MKVILFDVEGTLVDCVRQTIEAWKETFSQFGFAVSLDDLRSQSGRDGDEMLKRLLPEVSADVRKDMEKRQGRLYKENFLASVEPFPSVRQLFETLKDAGFQIALATTCQRDVLETYTGLLGIESLIDAVACGEDVRHGKPHPDLFQLACERLKSSLSDKTTAVGDTPYDAEAAARLGIAAVGLQCGGFSREDLEGAGCVAVFRDPAAFLAGRANWPRSMA
jgi:HAD superfamily hydrolase (TIGR01509 family)